MLPFLNTENDIQLITDVFVLPRWIAVDVSVSEKIRGFDLLIMMIDDFD